MRLAICAAVLASSLASGCTVIEQERTNYGGILDHWTDRVFVANTERMRVLRGVMLMALFSETAADNLKSPEESYLATIKFKRAAELLGDAYLATGENRCRYVTANKDFKASDDFNPSKAAYNPSQWTPLTGDGDSCPKLFDSLMVAAGRELIVVGRLSVPDVNATGFVSDLASQNYLNALKTAWNVSESIVSIAQWTFALYRDGWEIQREAAVATEDGKKAVGAIGRDASLEAKMAALKPYLASTTVGLAPPDSAFYAALDIMYGQCMRLPTGDNFDDAKRQSACVDAVNAFKTRSGIASAK